MSEFLTKFEGYTDLDISILRKTNKYRQGSQGHLEVELHSKGRNIPLQAPISNVQERIGEVNIPINSLEDFLSSELDATV